MHRSLITRLTKLETQHAIADGPQGDGLCALLAWARRQPREPVDVQALLAEDYDDLQGLARLLRDTLEQA